VLHVRLLNTAVEARPQAGRWLASWDRSPFGGLSISRSSRGEWCSKAAVVAE
jgi:hypothetical protein